VTPAEVDGAPFRVGLQPAPRKQRVIVLLEVKVGIWHSVDIASLITALVTVNQLLDAARG